MSSRKLSDCSNPMQACLAEFEERMKNVGLDFVRACTYRSNDEQAELFALGRTRPGLIMTHARPGLSRHNDTEDGMPSSNAADYYPLLAGKLIGDKTDRELDLWHLMGKLAKQCGLEWGGDWPLSKMDRPHVQLNNAAYINWVATTQKG